MAKTPIKKFEKTLMQEGPDERPVSRSRPKVVAPNLCLSLIMDPDGNWFVTAQGVSKAWPVPANVAHGVTPFGVIMGWVWAEILSWLVGGNLEKTPAMVPAPKMVQTVIPQIVSGASAEAAALTLYGVE